MKSKSSEKETLAPESSSGILLGHTGDWHFRHSQFSRKVRGDHFFRAGVSAVNKSHAAGIRYLINTGDILDRNRQRTCNIRELKAIDRLLVEKDMTMYTITGNHDLDSPTWLETLFDRLEGPGIVPVDNKIVTIPGTSHRVGGIAGHDAQDFVNTLKAAKDLPDVVLWHGGIDGFMGFSAYKVGYEQILEAAPSVKFFALGDLHFKKYYTINHQLIGYPGSTEMCSISEDPDKFVVGVRLDEAGARVERELLLDTTKVFKIHFTTDEEAAEALQWKKSVEAEEFCLIHLIYNQEHVDTARSFMVGLDESKTVVRRKRLSRVLESKGGELDLKNLLKSPEELLPKFVDERDPFMPFLVKLANKHYDPRIVVEQLIQEHAPKALRAL